VALGVVVGVGVVQDAMVAEQARTRACDLRRTRVAANRRTGQDDGYAFIPERKRIAYRVIRPLQLTPEKKPG
jgi:hypothetical protein